MLLQPVVFADDSHTPIPFEDACVQVYNMTDLVVFLENLLKRPPLLISYWNLDREEYEILTSLNSLLQHRGEDEGLRDSMNPTTTTNGNTNFNASSTVIVSAHLWVETRPPRLDVVDPDVDVEEYGELKSHVRNWVGNTHVMYVLQCALRVSCPRNERLFDHVRYNELKGNPERVELLYYTNNSLKINEVLQDGFSRGIEGGRVSALLSHTIGASSGNEQEEDKIPKKQHPLFVFSSSMTDKGQKELFSLEPHKVLLCEVAPGREWPSDVPLSKNLDAPPSGYDCVCYREERSDGRMAKSFRVGKNHQALPRYVLTIIGKKNVDSKLSFRGVRFAGATTTTTTSTTSNNTNMNVREKTTSSFSVQGTPCEFRRSRSVGDRISFQGGSAFSSKSSRRSGSESPMNKRRTRTALLPPSVTCSVHNETLLGLWCFNCKHMICPYCASVGEHRGHEVCSVETVASDMRRMVRDVCHTLSMELDNYHRLESQIQADRDRLKRKHTDAVRAMEAATADLHNLIDAKKQEWLERIREQSHSLDSPLKEVHRLLQQYEEIITTMEESYERAGEESQQLSNTAKHNSATVTSVVYLMEAPKLLDEGVQFASRRHDSALESAISTAKQVSAIGDALYQIDFSAVYQCIERIIPAFYGVSSGTSAMTNLSSPGVKYPRPSTTLGGSVGKPPSGNNEISPGMAFVPQHTNDKMDELLSIGLSGGTLDNSQVKVLLRRLSDVCTGYIWCLNDVSKYFHPDERRAVCSGPFRLLGLEWDLRIQAPDTLTRSKSSANGPTYSSQDEPVGLFLYPIGHTLRVDFRVTIFSAVSWVEWRVSGWTVALAGKGWGVYPLLPRRELTQTDRLAKENTLKICVTPISDLY